MIKKIKNLSNYIPKNEYSDFVKQYFLGMNKEGTKKFIENIDVKLSFIDVDGLLVPLSFSNNKKNCYTTSLLGALSYAIEELDKEKNFLKKYIFKLILKNFYFIFKFLKVEESVYVFNLLLSTNLYPSLSYKKLKKILNYLKKEYPNKAIIFRSINTNLTKNIYLDLLKLGFGKIASRQIFYFEKSNNLFKNKSIKEDKRAFEKMDFKIKNENFSFNDIKKIKQCYDDLYVKKYSKSNPLFTEYFYKQIILNSYFYINVLIDQEIEAVYGYYIVNDKVTTPIFGYKLENNKSKKLYRQITYLTLQNSLKKVNFLNHSSGVGKFKMNRGAKMDIEYLMFYIKHLNFIRKIPWKILGFISKKIIEKELKENIY